MSFFSYLKVQDIFAECLLISFAKCCLVVQDSDSVTNSENFFHCIDLECTGVGFVINLYSGVSL